MTDSPTARGELEQHSLHGGCPVLDPAQAKWGANLWLWSKDFVAMKNPVQVEIGLGRIVALCYLLIHFAPESLTYSVPLFLLKRQCDWPLDGDPAGGGGTLDLGHRPRVCGGRRRCIEVLPALPRNGAHAGQGQSWGRATLSFPISNSL